VLSMAMHNADEPSYSKYTRRMEKAGDLVGVRLSRETVVISPGTSTQMQLSEPVEVSRGASSSSPWLATHTL